MNNPVIRLLQDRFAGRSIADKPLSEEMMQDLMEAARLTPSCFNNQPWRFLFLEGEEALAKGAEILSDGNRPWASRAPLLIFGYSRAEDDCQIKDGREYHQFDLGMACMNLMLAATHHGLAARPMAGFSPKKVREHFHLDENDQPLVAIAVGYPSEDESHLADYYVGRAKMPRERKSAGEIVRRLG